ncbi:ABC transporter permease [Sneathiella chinensis]|uniref:ABC transporter n=1 Tax=Sneathiella chinensis TaxID=349750 RepID=A0ABQ5TYZ1_9PROT|nr:ABC transporter permease [Sneathiella chinensis]GLQ05089.1 ABC transporter [Sneathiella chinensis]
MRTGNLSLNIALTHLTGRLKPTITATLGVALGVAFYIAMTAMMEGFQGYFIQKIIDVSPHIEMKDEYRARPVQPLDHLYNRAEGAISLSSIKPKEEIRGIKNADRIVRTTSRMPGLKTAPTLEGQVVFRYGLKDLAATLVGIDPEREKQVTKLARDMVKGTLDDLQAYSGSVILGSELADELNADLGDRVTAISVSGTVKVLKVVGIFHTGIVDLDKTVSYALLKDAQILQNRPNVINAIRFSLDIPDNAVEIARQLENRFGYKTVSWQEANEGIISVFIVQDIVRYATSSAILLVACFGIFNIISTLINEKVRDIAILKSMGFTPADIQRVFLIQGMIIGLVGMILGWGLGYAMSRGLGAIRIDMEAIIATQYLFIVYDPIHYLTGGAACLLAAAFAAWMPARRAAALKPVDIIRGGAG